MYIWPEINPGGLIDSYREILPSDWRYVASIPEAVRNRVEGIASAKQTAPETARDSTEWRGKPRRPSLERGRRSARIIASGCRPSPISRPRRHGPLSCAKAARTYLLDYFDRTADREALASAKRELEAGLVIWEDLVKLTDGLYPAEMSFGPDDNGHWKDKLPYVRHDLDLVAEREDLWRRFGRFDSGFDFGGPVLEQPHYGAYRQDNYVYRNTVEPRFTAVDADSRYNDQTGFGWLADGDREAVAIPLTPYLEVRAVAKDPNNLPHDVLFRDYIRARRAEVRREGRAWRIPRLASASRSHSPGTDSARGEWPAHGSHARG